MTLSLPVKPTSERDILTKIGKTRHLDVLEKIDFVKMAAGFRGIL